MADPQKEEEEKYLRRHIEIFVSQEEYEKLSRAKGNATWREFLLAATDELTIKDKEILNELRALCEKIKK